MQKRLTLLGSTGSIGESTLDVVARHPDRFKVYALSAHRNGDKLVDQCVRFEPEVAVVGDADTAARVEAALRAKGLRETGVVLRHALRNALIPVVTLGALELGTLLSGAVLTEQVFSIPGFGKMIVDAVFNRDYPVVQGVVLVTAFLYVALN